VRDFIYSSALRKHSSSASVVQVESFKDPNPRTCPIRQKEGEAFFLLKVLNSFFLDPLLHLNWLQQGSLGDTKLWTL
jgi:hypothetical protein